MNFKQQLTWRNLDQQYAASTASQIARYAVGLRFEHLPDDVTHHAKRSLLDGLGNAIGGIIAPGLPACISVARALGSGNRAAAEAAAARGMCRSQRRVRPTRC